MTAAPRTIWWSEPNSLSAEDARQAEFAFDDLHHYVALAGGWSKTWIGARKLFRLHAFNAFDAAGNPTFVPSALVAPTSQNAKVLGRTKVSPAGGGGGDGLLADLSAFTAY